jgi:hypothetical protein
MVLWVSKVRTRWMFIVPTILVSPNPDQKGGIFFLQSFLVLLIPERSASSPMRPIGTSGVGLT